MLSHSVERIRPYFEDLNTFLMIDFGNIMYLKLGNKRQQEAYHELIGLHIFESLKNYNPILTGTIPIEIDLPESDLDIICQCKDHIRFSSLLSELFEDQNDFEVYTYDQNQIKTTIARFTTKRFTIEIFGQDIPTILQSAYRHMMVEYKILNLKGEAFKAGIIKLKQQGYKTEPAFAKLLRLKGDPYTALLNIKV